MTSEALREIGEELGIVGPRPLLLFKHRYEDAHSRRHIGVYRVTWDRPIRHQADEIAWGAFCSLQEIIENKRAWRFVPDGLDVFNRFLSSQKAP